MPKRATQICISWPSGYQDVCQSASVSAILIHDARTGWSTADHGWKMLKRRIHSARCKSLKANVGWDQSINNWILNWQAWAWKARRRFSRSFNCQPHPSDPIHFVITSRSVCISVLFDIFKTRFCHYIGSLWSSPISICWKRLEENLFTPWFSGHIPAVGYFVPTLSWS